MARRRRVGVCIFCGQTGTMTREHVVARWGREAVATQIGLNKPVRMVRSSRPGQVLRTDIGLSIRLNDSICGPCNNGWLHEWEDKVGPWLAPAVRSEITAIGDGAMREWTAAWAVKTALLYVASLHLQSGEGFVPQSHLKWLYENRKTPKPPPGSQGWFAALDTQSTAGQSTTMWLGDHIGTPEAYITTFAIGHLVVQVFGQDFINETTAVGGGPINVLKMPRAFLPYAVQIWPEVDGDPVVVWPPRSRLTEVDLRVFASWAGMKLTPTRMIEGRRGRITPVTVIEPSEPT